MNFEISLLLISGIVREMFSWELDISIGSHQFDTDDARIFVVYTHRRIDSKNPLEKLKIIKYRKALK